MEIDRSRSLRCAACVPRFRKLATGSRQWIPWTTRAYYSLMTPRNAGNFDTFQAGETVHWTVFVPKQYLGHIQSFQSHNHCVVDFLPSRPCLRLCCL